MKRLKITGLILAGVLAITPAAFARGFGGGGFHGGGFHGGGQYGWHKGNYAGGYWHNGNWYGGHWNGGQYAYGSGPYYGGYVYGGGPYYGGYVYGGPYYGWGYPYGYYDYGYPYSYSDDQNSNTVTASWESTVVAVQQELAKLGYYHGQIDGIDGPETQKAIRWFQSTDKIAVTGQINGQTLKALWIS